MTTTTQRPNCQEDVEDLIHKAACAKEGKEAMGYSQAAYNAANAMHTLKSAAKL